MRVSTRFINSGCVVSLLAAVYCPPTAVRACLRSNQSGACSLSASSQSQRPMPARSSTLHVHAGSVPGPLSGTVSDAHSVLSTTWNISRAGQPVSPARIQTASTGRVSGCMPPEASPSEQGQQFPKQGQPARGQMRECAVWRLGMDAARHVPVWHDALWPVCR